MNIVPYYNVPVEKESKYVIIDADSLVHMVSYSGKNEDGENLPPYTEDDMELLEGKLRELLLSILNRVEEKYNIIKYYLCAKGVGNFRKDIYPPYKANRPSKSDIIMKLFDYLVKEMGAIPADGYEADDLVYTLSASYDHSAIIVAVDKDLLQIPSIFYNHQKDSWIQVSETQARLNLALQVLTGDPSDNVNLTPGFGIKKAVVTVTEGMTDYQYVKSIFKVYSKIWGDTAKEKLRLCYNLLKLHYVK